MRYSAQFCEQQTHPIAFAHAKREQSSGRAIHFIVELLIGEHATVGFQKEKLFLGRPLDLGLEQLANVIGQALGHAVILSENGCSRKAR